MEGAAPGALQMGQGRIGPGHHAFLPSKGLPPTTPAGCAFHRPDDALGTAIRLQSQVTAWCREQSIDPPLSLKVGVHHGPAIAMTANDQLDYFGRTVNLAARVADQSRGGVVVLQSVLDQADRAVLAKHSGVAAERFTTRLRGLTQEQRLVRLTVKAALRAG
jgi:adenylate cyclase